MRGYVPVEWPLLEELARTAALPGPLAGWCVDPVWRSAASDVTEEEWEYEALATAAEDLAPAGGAVLAIEAAVVPPAVVDGRFELPGTLVLADVQAVFSQDLSWFGVQEIEDLLRTRPA
ncbi:MAG: hypothetical protein WCF04_01575 [Candidatus Nanopelagicales bacterium]